MPSERSRRTRRHVLRTIGAVGTLTAAGCSNPVSLDGPTADWRHELSNASGAGPPAVGDDVLLVGAQDKGLHAFDAANGDRAFTYETGGPIEARPVPSGADGLAHVRSTDGDVYAVDEAGDRRWSHEGVSHRGELGAEGSLLVENVPLYDDPAIRGFDAATGELRFRVPTRSYRLPGLTGAGFALSVPADDDHSRVRVLSLADGSVRWESDLQPSYAGVVADEELVVTAHDHVLTAYAIGDGTRRWQQTVDRVAWAGGPYLGTGVYLAYETGDRHGIGALDRTTGSVRWRKTVGFQIRSVEPTTDAIFVGSRVADPEGGSKARLDCFESDGTRRWKTVTGVPDVEAIDVLEETVLVTSGRQLVALDRATGATLWTHDPDSGSRLAVATGSNSVYVSYRDEGAVAKFSLS